MAMLNNQKVISILELGVPNFQFLLSLTIYLCLVFFFVFHGIFQLPKGDWQ